MTTTQSRSSAIKGILGKKLGMTQVFDSQNKIVPVTVIEAGPCVVTQIRTIEKDGYTAVQLAYGAVELDLTVGRISEQACRAFGGIAL